MHVLYMYFRTQFRLGDVIGFVAVLLCLLIFFRFALVRCSYHVHTMFVSSPGEKLKEILKLCMYLVAGMTYGHHCCRQKK